MRRNYDYNDDYNCGKNVLQKTCRKDPTVKDSRCDQTNQVHVNVNDAKEDYKDCKPKKDKKFGCCCDTDSLRDLLLFFRRNNTPIFILSETFPIIGENPTDTPVFVNSIVGNLVYISRGSSRGPVITLMPLCKIDYVLISSDTPIPGLVNFINEIITEPTLEKEDCCCIKGIGDTINSVSNISVLLPLTNAILLESNTLIISLALFILGEVQSTTAVGNDDLYILYFETQISSLYLITPVCNIDSLIAIENVTDENGVATSSTMVNSFLPYLNKDMKEKLKNISIDKIFKEISGIPFDEALEKLNSVLS
ncbi:hypothetical protein GCM10008905_31180 [Clostridium malenominatum]|uniref:Proteasome assembly chaperone 1 n=1 Tax=Clostridium malenominatum TaxID=1539 RepID=A0ABP3UFB9_9CLOT